MKLGVDLDELGLESLREFDEFPGLLSGEETGRGEGRATDVVSPVDGACMARVGGSGEADVERAGEKAAEAFRAWRDVPAPVRGELVRRIGEELRKHKEALGKVVTLEAGKIVSEAEGEVQEMIDICEFAVGLSRQLYGLTIASERPGHRLMEQWHPMGPVGVITAFNFPVAVWAWNAMIALTCGDPVVWKPSEKTPLCALACHRLAQQAVQSMPEAPAHLLSVVMGGAAVGQAMAANPRFPLVSATGSVSMGRAVGTVVARRLARSILELGGNNGMIVTPTADIEMALRAIVFAAAGTCGQRCTTLRRLIVHVDIADALVGRLERVYEHLVVGDPRMEKTLVGPLIDENAYERMQGALDAARNEGAGVTGGERVTEGVPSGGFYVRPAIVRTSAHSPLLQQEVFAPILYVLTYRELDEAIKLHNGVPQGLASAIFTDRMTEAERFLAPGGSDCGIANVNIGTSGAEIGGAFGGEKDTGGGRESGSDSWKAYMRRQTATVNYSEGLPLAQGVRFDI
jgi:aldehyde dehydrogenase (NAD+)